METVFLVCAVVGGTLLVCQFLLGLLGFGDHHDVSHDVGHDVSHGDHDGHGHGDGDGHDAHGAVWFFSILTFRTIVAALTFFGLAGMSSLQAQLEPEPSLAIALLAGAAALFIVAWLMKSLRRLKADGTVRIERAVGKNGTVYLKIPGGKAGAGKVHLNLQNRTVECQAITAEGELATGAAVVVVAVLGPDTVEVAPVEKSSPA